MTHSDIDSRKELFRLHTKVKNPLARTVLKAVGKPLNKMLALEAIAKGYRNLPTDADQPAFLEAIVQAFGLSCDISPRDLEAIPSQGPLMVVANHPFGAVEGLMLARMLLKVRPDVKIMANHLLGQVPELKDLFMLVDPFGTEKSLARNIAPLRQCVAWLRRGGCLGVFPAGEVAHFKLGERRVAEPEWSPSIARIVKACGATVIPVHFSGANGPLFHLAGLLHPRLRTALLGREFVNKARKTVEARVGAPIEAARLEAMDDVSAARFLRLRTEMLGGVVTRRKRLGALPPAGSLARREALIPPQDPELMAAELAKLPPEAALLHSGEFTVFEAQAQAIPLTLREIGRLREATFRKVGEGTGKSCDLDDYDAYYSHVFIWNSVNREVVGAYRLGRTDRILAERGQQGLYVSTLFKLKPGFARALGPALEMGRSFVRQEYQKSYNALLLLWKGIGKVVAREPRYRRLFGPVSVTNDYRPASRQVIARYFESRREEPELARLVKPRTPLKGPGWLARATRSLVQDLDGLSELVSSLESDRKGIPVLMRQYLKLGGKMLAFNVDRSFSDALDGLIVVDLMETDRKQLERYLGREGLAGFLDHHQGGWRNSA